MDELADREGEASSPLDMISEKLILKKCDQFGHIYN